MSEVMTMLEGKVPATGIVVSAARSVVHVGVKSLTNCRCGVAVFVRLE